MYNDRKRESNEGDLYMSKKYGTRIWSNKVHN